MRLPAQRRALNETEDEDAHKDVTRTRSLFAAFEFGTATADRAKARVRKGEPATMLRSDGSWIS